MHVNTTECILTLKEFQPFEVRTQNQWYLSLHNMKNIFMVAAMHNFKIITLMIVLYWNKFLYADDKITTDTMNSIILVDFWRILLLACLTIFDSYRLRSLIRILSTFFSLVNDGSYSAAILKGVWFWSGTNVFLMPISFLVFFLPEILTNSIWSLIHRLWNSVHISNSPYTLQTREHWSTGTLSKVSFTWNSICPFYWHFTSFLCPHLRINHKYRRPLTYNFVTTQIWIYIEIFNIICFFVLMWYAGRPTPKRWFITILNLTENVICWLIRCKETLGSRFKVSRFVLLIRVQFDNIP